MHPVVFTDLEDTPACDEGGVTEDPGSLSEVLGVDMLCLDVFYALVGCGIAYVMSTYR